MKQADILRRCRDYLDQIDLGKDPLTGEKLPENTVLRDDPVYRALFFAARDLERIVIFDSDRRRPPYAPDPRLREKIKAAETNLSARKMQELINRTRDPIETRGFPNGGRGRDGLMDYLTVRGLVRRGGQRYILTAGGRGIGLVDVIGMGICFSPEAQQFLLDALDDLADFCARTCPESESLPRRKLEYVGGEGAPGRVRDELETLQALSRGRHPGTGKPLPSSDPACQERMKSCFGYGARALERALELGCYSAKASFSLTPAEWEGIPISDEPCGIAEFCARVSGRLADPTAVEGLTGPKLMVLLEQAGLLEKDAAGRRVATQHGAALGIAAKSLVGKEGAPYEVQLYGPDAQRYMKALLKPYVRAALP